MKNSFLLYNTLLLVALVCAPAWAQTQNPSAPTAAQEKTATTKIVQLLEGSGHTYAKAKDNVWVIKFKGNQREEIPVIIIYAENMLILVSVVAEKAEVKVSPEMQQKLLKLNDHLDRVKVGIDNEDDDVFVRIDLSLRVVDEQEFKANLEQISAAADETYAALKPFLVAPKKTGQ